MENQILLNEVEHLEYYIYMCQPVQCYVNFIKNYYFRLVFLFYCYENGIFHTDTQGLLLPFHNTHVNVNINDD